MSRYLDPFLEMLVAERGAAANTRACGQGRGRLLNPPPGRKVVG